VPEVGRVLHDQGLPGAFATNANVEVDWVGDMFTEDSLRAWNRGADSHRNMELPPEDFPQVTETRIVSSQVMAAEDVVAWFRTHSN
jgi:hypothetical protein